METESSHQWVRFDLEGRIVYCTSPLQNNTIPLLNVPVFPYGCFTLGE